jgi:hypothetical protein
VFEDVAVVHVAAAVGGEADGDFGDLVGVDADGVLEAAFVVVDGVAALVVRVAVERDCGGDGEVSYRSSTGKNVVASSKWAAAAR